MQRIEIRAVPGWKSCLRLKASKLPRQSRGAFGGVERLGQGGARIPREFLRGQLQAEVPLDNRQDVVEIVRHAGGELADGLHLLRLAQLLLQFACAP